MSQVPQSSLNAERNASKAPEGMGTPFFKCLDPPGPSIQDWSPHHRTLEQPFASSLPQTFLDAMLVREKVFIDEQHCSWENEVDADDPRSFHFVIYAPSSNLNSHNSLSAQDGIPVGVVRFTVPMPESHDHHTATEAPAAATTAATEPSHANAKYHAPHLRLGRLAVLSEYRKHKLGRLIVEYSLKFARENPRAIEAYSEPGTGQWEGLVLIHAQKEVQRFWERMGFELDEGMGEWVEEGIDHIGMWQKLDFIN
jgi:predicted GNAT family N-acyltransferase